MIEKTEQEIIRQWSEPNQLVVSICCISFNHQDYIAQTIKSFLMQRTNYPFEILIYDDASTDNTQAIIRDYAQRYPRLIKPIFQTENMFSKGVRPNPTFNFTRAKGRYIAICEGDDYWTDPTKLQQQLEFLERHQDYVITYTRCQAFDENGIIEKEFGGATRDLTDKELFRCTPISTLTVCFRNVIDTMPRESCASIYGDKFLWSMLSEHGKGKFLDTITPAAYRVHAEGLHSKTSRKMKWMYSASLYIGLFFYNFRKHNPSGGLYFLFRGLAIIMLLLIKADYWIDRFKD